MILCDDGPIEPQHLPRRFTDGEAPVTKFKAVGPCTLRELEVQAIDDALDRHEGNKRKAANELGVSLKTLYNKLSQTASLEKSA